MKIGRKWQAVLILGGLILLPLMWHFAQDTYWHTHADSAFKSITWRELPPGVKATAYAHEMTDAILHTTHYWLLTGTKLKQMTNGTGFTDSEDAREWVPDLQRLFGITYGSTRVVAGYEWELDRDRWLVILAGETNAVYAH